MKIGFLPLYIQLYDEVVPEIRPRLERFYETLCKMLEDRGFEVVKSGFCRLKHEFKSAVELFEFSGADAIVTVHMAYSPSLESVDELCAASLPVIVLDTTETLEFTNLQDPAEIMFNHGIHGVMDMCSMLTRKGKPYAIAAGHYLDSDVIDRVCGFVRAAVCANRLKASNVGLIGGAFDGMGDFRVSYEELYEKFGIKVAQMNPGIMRKIYNSITDEEYNGEIEANKRFFSFGDNIIPEEYELSVRSCLALRKYCAEEKLNAFSVNFTQMGFDSCGLTSMPFIECCKAMSHGIGYAGEGDALTAAFTGAFLAAYPDSSFVEIFCPDWKNGTLLLSHMGEVNYNISDGRPVIMRAGTNYSPAAFPYAGYTRMKAAEGVYANVSRAKDGYKLVISKASLKGFDKDSFEGSIRGWLQPEGKSTAEFLENLSLNGATHHSVFVTGAKTRELKFFGKLCGIETVEI